MRIRGQAPREGEPANFLNRGSASGAILRTIKVTNFGSTSFSVAAGGNTALEFSASIYPLDLPRNERTDENVYSWDNVLVIPYYDIFVDTDDDFDYEFGAGPSLSAGQLNIQMSQYELITPNSGTSFSSTFVFKNSDVSSHTIYWYGGAKYLILE